MTRASLIFLGLFALPILATQNAQTANAADGELAAAVQMYAGPSNSYPEVRRLAKGLSVDIHGCLKSWDWCDVTWRGNRGWVPASAINTGRSDGRLSLKDYGRLTGVPEVTFQLNSYWDANYNGALWYPERASWARRGANYNVR